MINVCPDPLQGNQYYTQFWQVELTHTTHCIALYKHNSKMLVNMRRTKPKPSDLYLKLLKQILPDIAPLPV
jgi:hypothetical protein